ncbi:hypothetical protein SCALM49S_09156 [Streptomyces californicus]
MKASKIAYKPVGFALGALSGMIAGAVFQQTWKLIEGEGDAPDALDEDRLSGGRYSSPPPYRARSSPWSRRRSNAGRHRHPTRHGHLAGVTATRSHHDRPGRAGRSARPGARPRQAPGRAA